MKWYCLSIRWKNKNYILSKYSGNLFSKEIDKLSCKQRLAYPNQLIRALEICENPFIIKSTICRDFNNSFENVNKNPYYILKKIIYLCRVNILIARFYASISSPIFENSIEAINYFHVMTMESQRNELCLPRSLFAAKTSKTFKQSGVVIIGAFLPTRMMHAWVIDSELISDEKDNVWHQYCPVAAIC